MSDVNIRIKVDNKDSISAVNQIDKSVDNLTKTLVNLDDQVSSGFADMNDTVETTADSYEDLKKSVDDTADSQEKLAKSSKTANKGMGILKKGAKAVGGAFKAMGIGLIIGLFISLWEALKKNQAIMDVIDVVMTSVSIVFQRLSEVLINTFKSVSDATGGFDAMKKVVGGLIELALTPLKLSFYAIKAAVLGAQLIWEKSFLGDNDPTKIKELTASLAEVKQEVVQVGLDAIEAGKQIKDNFKEAVQEVGTLVTNVAENTQKAISDMTVKGILEQSKAIVEGIKNYDRLDQVLQRQQLLFQTMAEEQRQIRDDESADINDRIAANQELGRILEKQLAAELSTIAEKIAIKQQELALNKDNIALQNEIYQLETDRIDVNERITGQRSEQLANENALLKEQQEIKTANADELAEKEAERVKKKKETDQEAKDDLKEAHDKKLENLKAYLAVASQVAGAAGAILDFYNAKQSRELDERYQREIDLAGDNAKAKEAVDKKYAKQKAQLEYKQAQAKKAQSLVDAALGTAVAIATAGANIPLAILAGVIGAIQFGIIAGTPIPKPSYGRGGVTQGPSHADGGIATPFGEMEGNEGIINKNSMSNPSLRNLASAVNVAGGGVEFGTGGGAIKLDIASVAAIVNGINDKRVVVSNHEIETSQSNAKIIENESNI